MLGSLRRFAAGLLPSSTGSSCCSVASSPAAASTLAANKAEVHIEVPENVKVEYKYPNLYSYGPLGVKRSSLKMFEHFAIRAPEESSSSSQTLSFKSYLPDTTMSFARGPKWRNQKVEHRLNQLSKLVEADFEGVTVGYKKELELRGLGFKWQLEENKSSALDDLKGKGKDSNSNVLSTVSTLDLDGDTLVMNIGFSHEVRFTLPAQVKCEVLNPTELVLRSTSKDMLGRTSKDIQKLPRRDVYKGKGIFEKGFMPRLKEAKRK